MVNDLDYKCIKFPVSEKDCCGIEQDNNICINLFCYENGLTYFAYVWLMILSIYVLNFLFLKKITVELNRIIIFASMYFVMEMV